MKKLALTAAIALLMPSPAFSASAINLATPGAEYSGRLYTLGFQFSVSSAQTIDALGVYDNRGDGLTSVAQIGLWSIDGTLLRSTMIAAGGGTLDGLFRYASVTPYALTAGTDYVVGAYTTDLATSLGANQGGTGTANPLINIVRDRFSDFNSAFRFPEESENRRGGAWLGANFNLATSVPEPATWAMLIAGFGLVGGAMRRRSSVRVTYA